MTQMNLVRKSIVVVAAAAVLFECACPLTAAAAIIKNRVSKKAIIDPLFTPSDARQNSENPAAVRQQNLPAKDQNGIIDPLFKPQSTAAVDEKAIIDPLFQPEPENKRGS